MHVKTSVKFRDSCGNVFDIYEDSRENVLGIWADVIVLSPISSVRGNTEACAVIWKCHTKVISPAIE